MTKLCIEIKNGIPYAREMLYNYRAFAYNKDIRRP